MHSFLHIIVTFAIILLLIKPVGKYFACVFMGKRTFLDKPMGFVERFIYRVCCIDHTQEMNWVTYAYSALILGFFGFIILFLILSFQHLLPLNPQGYAGVSPALAFNIAIGFVTNGNWQSYSGETTLSHFSQTLGLTVQNFISTATGLTAFAVLGRGIARKQVQTIGNFYVDVVRGILYIFLPLAFIFSIFLTSQGVVQNISTFVPYQAIETTEEGLLPQGAVASQVAIRTLGSSGGGFFGTNGAHPFENPTPLSNFIQSLVILLIPMSLVYGFGYMIGDKKHGWAVLAVMSIIFFPAMTLSIVNEKEANPLFDLDIIDGSQGNMEGKEIRSGIEASALHAVAATATSNGSSNSMLDSYFPLGAIGPVILTQFSEVIFGGIGSGIYNIFAFIILTVFLGGLMIGRTPEYMGKKITIFDVKMASLIVIIPAIVVLLGTAIAVSLPDVNSTILNKGAQGFTEILYAFTSAGNNDGAMYAGLNANTDFYNTALGLCMFISRYFIIVAAYAIAGSFAAKNIAPINAASLPTNTPMFVFLLTFVLIIVGILTYIPSIALGPLAEHFHLKNLALEMKATGQ